MKTRAEARRTIAAGVREAKAAHAQALKIAREAERRIPRLVAARRRHLATEVAHLRATVRDEVDARRQAIARARESLKAYIEEKRGELRKLRTDAAAKLEQYRAHLRHLAAVKGDRWEQAARDYVATQAGFAARPSAVKRQAASRRNAEDLWRYVDGELQSDDRETRLARALVALAHGRRHWQGRVKARRGESIQARAERIAVALREYVESHEDEAQAAADALAAAQLSRAQLAAENAEREALGLLPLPVQRPRRSRWSLASALDPVPF